MARGEREVSKVVRRARQVIDLSAAALVLLFGWLKLNNAALGTALSGASPDFLLRIAMVVYFFCWVRGTRNDADEQELAYSSGIQGGFPKGGYISALGIAGVFALLCLVHTAELFSVLLVAFLMLNVLTWRYLTTKIVQRAVSESKGMCRSDGDIASDLILDNFVAYISGRWQWWRFAYGICVAIGMLVIAILGAPEIIAEHIDRDTLLGWMLLFYVLTFEGWIWYMRVRTRLVRQTIDRIDTDYKIV